MIFNILENNMLYNKDKFSTDYVNSWSDVEMPDQFDVRLPLNLYYNTDTFISYYILHFWFCLLLLEMESFPEFVSCRKKVTRTKLFFPFLFSETISFVTLISSEVISKSQI